MTSINPMKNVEVVAVRDFDSLQPHMRAWDNLAWDAGQGMPASSPAWVTAFLHHKLRPDEKWLSCFCYLDHRLIGVLPVISGPHPLLGEGRPVLRTPSDKHTPSSDILLDPDWAQVALHSLLHELTCQVPNHLGINFKAVRSNSHLWRALQTAAPGYFVRSGFRFEYSYLNVEGSFDQYLSGIKSMRSNLRRFRKKLDQRGLVSIEIAKGPTAAADFLPEFLSLEASGWKGRTKTAIRFNPSDEAFYSEFIKMLAEAGRLEWHTIRVDGHLVAAQLCFLCGRSLILDKYAFDEDFAECRPGSLLTEVTFREAFSRPDIIEVNPVSRASAHEIWHMPQDEYINVHLVRRRIIPAVVHYPRVRLQSLYQERLRARIPVFVKQIYKEYKRRGDRKPKRASDIALPSSAGKNLGTTSIPEANER